MKQVQFKLTGTAPLLQHNVRLADPLDPATKEIAAVSKKRGKSDADHEALAYLEFKGGIYFDASNGPYVPATWVEKALLDSAKREKLGPQVKSFVRAMEDRFPIQYEGPRTVDALWKQKFYHKAAIGVGTKKVMRTRPMFSNWAIICTIMFDEGALDAAQIVRIMERAGLALGIGDYRPRFGRFSCEVVK